MNRINQHIANIESFVKTFLRCQGYPYFLDTDVFANIAMKTYLKYDAIVFQAAAINEYLKLSLETEPVEVTEEWFSEDVQDGLYHVLRRRGRPVAQPKVPKRSRTAYEFFVLDRRSLVKELMPYAKVQQVNQYLGEWWSRVKELEAHKAEYKIYLSMEEADRARFVAKSGDYRICKNV